MEPARCKLEAMFRTSHSLAKQPSMSDWASQAAMYAFDDMQFPVAFVRTMCPVAVPVDQESIHL
jgi:hypothetical protein